MLKISTAPHFYSSVDTRSIMRDVIIALIPAGLAAVALFGMAAVITMATAVAGCVFFEYAGSKWWLKTPPATRDLSAVVTGLLLAYNLPCKMPVWMTLIGCFVAIIITKTAFGGIGKNLFNPALVGRVFLFISFPVQMTTWVRPHLFDFMNTDVTTSATTLGIIKHIDASSSATQLTEKMSELPDYLEMFLGYTGGSMGEVSALMLLIGGLYLIWRKVINWQTPVAYIATVAVLTVLFPKAGGAEYMLYSIFGGGLFLGAFFMATDYATSPVTKKGQLIYGIGCGLFTVFIRYFGSYNEGVCYSIMVMNCCTALIDKYTKPVRFGVVKSDKKEAAAK